MRDLKLYWKEIRSIAGSLPDFVWLVSVEGNGCIVEVAAARAAPLLYAKSHRLAGQAEVEAHRAEQESAKRRLANEALQKQGVAVVPISRL